MKKVVFLVFIFVSKSWVSAQQSQVITFEEAIKIALQNNVNLNQQKNLLEFNQNQKTSAMASLGPSVNLNGQATEFNGNSFNQQQGRVINGVRDNVSGSINANLTLFNGFSNIANYRAANAQLEAQSYFVKRTSQDVINTVASQYLQVLLDLELYRIAKENYEAQKKQLEQVTVQVELGARPPVDAYNQEAQTNSAELRMLQAEININNDKAILTTTLLLDPFQNIDVVKPSWSLTEIMNDARDHEALYELAKINRGDLQRAINQEKAAQYGMVATRGGMMPTLNAFFSYGSSYNFQHNVPDSATFGTTGYVLNGTQIDKVTTYQTVANPDAPRPFGEQFGTNNVYKSYGLQMTIPLFNGLQNRTRYYQQKVVYQNASLNRSNVEIQAKTDVLRTYRNFQVQKKTFTVSQSQLKAADQAFQLERERYNLGVTNFVDYTRASAAFVQAQTDLAQTEFRLLFQKVLLEYATGTLKAEDVGN
jgi:outer membrane protein